jgi:hypothetical protein
MMANWTVPFPDIAASMNRSIERVVRSFAMETFARVIQRSPVDTGRFKGNWFPSLNGFTSFVGDSVDPGGAATLARMRTSVSGWPVGGVMYLTNSLPYAMTIEYGGYPNPPKNPTGKTIGGFSTQAPAGVVRVTAEEMVAQLSQKFPNLNFTEAT